MFYNVHKEVPSAINTPLQEQVKEAINGATVTKTHSLSFADLIFMAMMDNYEGDQKLTPAERKNRFRVGLMVAQAPRGKLLEISAEDAALVLKYAEKNAKFSILLFGRLHEFFDSPVPNLQLTDAEGKSAA